MHLPKSVKANWIFQRHEDDCGIAALAMLFDTEYSYMRRKVLPIVKSRAGVFSGTSGDDAILVAAGMGLKLTVYAAEDFPVGVLAQSIQGHPAVLIVPARDGSDDWHAVYWTGKYLLDPSPGRRYGISGKKALKTMHSIWFPGELPAEPI